jgi:hypothetical protein
MIEKICFFVMPQHHLEKTLDININDTMHYLLLSSLAINKIN